MRCIGCGNDTGDRFDTCRECDEACDRWEAQRPEREQRERERLDSAGYYDGDPNWRENLKAQRVNRG